MPIGFVCRTRRHLECAPGGSHETVFTSNTVNRRQADDPLIKQGQSLLDGVLCESPDGDLNLTECKQEVNYSFNGYASDVLKSGFEPKSALFAPLIRSNRALAGLPEDAARNRRRPINRTDSLISPALFSPERCASLRSVTAHECAGDFIYAKGAQDVEHQRDLRFFRKPGRAAGEHHAKLIVLDCVCSKKLLDDGSDSPFAIEPSLQLGREGARACARDAGHRAHGALPWPSASRKDSPASRGISTPQAHGRRRLARCLLPMRGCGLQRCASTWRPGARASRRNR